MGGELGQTIAIIGIMVAVLLAAYYATKFLAKKGKRLTQSKHIKVMDQVYLASDKQIALIKVGEKNILVGITNQSINPIAEIDEISQAQPQKETNSAEKPKDLVSIAKNFIKKLKTSQSDLKSARMEHKKSVRFKKNDAKDDFASIMESINSNKQRLEKNLKDSDHED